jgi:tetratricopeptide (TPR) repeat protein
MIRIILLISLFVGCASNSQKSKSVDINKVTNDDFKKKEAIVYNNKKDYHDAKRPESQALIDESIYRFSEDQSAVQGDDVVSQISMFCYSEKFDKAFALIDSNTDQQRNNPAFWNLVANCFYMKNERRKALLFYNKALEINPSYAPALNNIGVLYKRYSEDAKAMLAFNRAMSADSFAKTPRFNKGLIYLEFNQPESALKIFEGLIANSPQDIDLISLIATAHLQRRDYKKAISYFTKVPSKYHRQPYIGINYAYANFLLGDNNQAKNIINRIETSELNDWENYYISVKNKIEGK